MPYFLEVVLLLDAFLAAPSSLRRSSLEGSGLRAPGTFGLEHVLKDFDVILKPTNKFMDVFVPPDCLKNNAALFKTFLNTGTQSFTFWTDGRSHFDVCHRKPCVKFRLLFLRIIYFICGKYDLDDFYFSTVIDYFTTIFVVEESARNRSQDHELDLLMPFLPPYPKASGRYVLSPTNRTMFWAGELESNVLSLQNRTEGMHIERRRKLNGSYICLICRTSYACEHPSFNVTVELLRHRNASVSIHRDTKQNLLVDEAYRSTFINSMGVGSTYTDMLSTLSSVHPFGSAGFSFYVRKRDRVPKETIFFLPFAWEVWLALFGSCMLLVLTFSLIVKATVTPNVDLTIFVFSMLAAFFQQGIQLHRSLLTKQLSRLVYGLTSLMFVVLSTGFKGRLTSLLNDLPLQGEATQFVSFEDIIRKRNRLCILEYPDLIFTAKGGGLLLGSPIKVGYKCYQHSNSNPHSRRSINIATDGKDTFFTCNSRTGPSEALRRELLRRGYVQTEGTAFSYPVGPEMRASSVYRHDFGATLSRGIEAGFYVRHAALAEYKSRSFNEGNSESTEGLVLSLRDLRPFFLAWIAGVTLCVVVFIGEVLSARIRCRNCTDRIRLVFKQRSRRRLRKARLTEKTYHQHVLQGN